MKKKKLLWNPVRWWKFKTWFIWDLPLFIKERGFKNGVELGVKSGRSMYFMLRQNPDLTLWGIDLWEIIEGGAYKYNDRNEHKCINRLQKFGSRVNLIKMDALEAASLFEDHSLDFVFYDLQTRLMAKQHLGVIRAWLPKLKNKGVLIGRDFRDFRADFYALGYQETDLKKAVVKGRVSRRLEYLEVEHNEKKFSTP